jgi:hypothetical protein
MKKVHSPWLVATTFVIAVCLAGCPSAQPNDNGNNNGNNGGNNGGNGNNNGNAAARFSDGSIDNGVIRFDAQFGIPDMAISARSTSGDFFVAGTMTNLLRVGEWENAEAHIDVNTSVPSIFVVKYNQHGVRQWIHVVAEASECKLSAIESTGGGKFVISGSAEGPITAGTTRLDLQGRNIFLLQCNPDATVDWVRAVTGPSREEAGKIVHMQDGKIVLTGTFSEYIVFDPYLKPNNPLEIPKPTKPGKGELKLTSEGRTDGFIALFNSLGELKWARQISGLGNDGATACYADSRGIFACGYFEKTATLGSKPNKRPHLPGIEPYVPVKHTAIGGADGFVQKLDFDGYIQWSRTLGGKAHDRFTDMDDYNGKKFVVGGNYGGPMEYERRTLQGTQEKATLAHIGDTDMLFWELDPEGKSINVQGLGSTGADACKGVETDNTHVFACGEFGGTLRFDHWTLTNTGNANCFFAGWNGAVSANDPYFLGSASGDGIQLAWGMCPRSYVTPAPSGATGKDVLYFLGSYMDATRFMDYHVDAEYDLTVDDHFNGFLWKTVSSRDLPPN